MKIVFIGGVKFGHALLSTILSRGWNVSIIFSYKDSKRKFYSDMASFDELARQYKIKHIKVDNINDEENIQILKEEKPDLILVMGWSQLLKNKILKIPTIGVIGSHPTELPKYRGRAPIPWTIIKNLKDSALTFFYIEEGVDDGDILDQRKFSISSRDNATSIYEKITILGKEMLLENLQILQENNAVRKKQDPRKFIENWPKRTIEDGKINWFHTAEDIDRLIRASAYPYPGAFTQFRNEKLIIWKSDFSNDSNFAPGKIKEVNNDYVIIGTGNGIIRILKANYMTKNNLLEIFSSTDIGLNLE